MKAAAWAVLMGLMLGFGCKKEGDDVTVVTPVVPGSGSQARLHVSPPTGPLACPSTIGNPVTLRTIEFTSGADEVILSMVAEGTCTITVTPSGSYSYAGLTFHVMNDAGTYSSGFGGYTFWASEGPRANVPFKIVVPMSLPGSFGERYVVKLEAQVNVWPDPAEVWEWQVDTVKFTAVTLESIMATDPSPQFGP